MRKSNLRHCRTCRFTTPSGARHILLAIRSMILTFLRRIFLSKLKGTEGFAESMSYWTFTDIFEENGPVPSPFHGGFGLLNFQGLRKPAFYAYQFLNRLGDEELASSDRIVGPVAARAGCSFCFGISLLQ